MREIKDSQLQYYCNGVGEIHECGKRMLDSVDELPQPLQRPYLEYWTDEWNLYCHIAFLDGLPGILLCAEYDDDYCQKQGIPTEYDAQYAVLFHYGERLEKLAQEINPRIIVGLNYDSVCDPQIMLFIPTEHVTLQDILKRHYTGVPMDICPGCGDMVGNRQIARDLWEVKRGRHRLWRRNHLQSF